MAHIHEIRLYRPGDEAGITRLFREVYGREMSLDEWRWKYRESYPKKIYAAVAVNEEGCIIGHYGSVCLPFIYQGRPARGLAICDVMIQPKYRGIGTLKRLSSLVPAEAVKDGIILGYGFPNRMTLLKPALSLGIYEKIEDVLEANKTVSFDNGLARYMFRFFPLDFSDERTDHLWQACRMNFPLAVVRDRSYLLWRYAHHKLFRYELWGLARRLGRDLKGLAVLRREEHRVLIVDFLFRPGFMGPLFRKIENSLYHSGGENMTLWTSPSLEKKLVAYGFSTGPGETSIPRTTHEPTLTKAEIEGKFFYTMGDTDFL